MFIPLLLTWTGLAFAAYCYGELLSEDSAQEKSKPFLQLWQAGFNRRLWPLLRFGDVAFTAVVFIVLLLLLAAVHSLARHRALGEAERQDADHQRLLGRLTIALTRAQLVLNGKQLTSPAHFESALGASAQRLTELIEGATRTQEAAARTLKSSEDLATRLVGTADQVSAAAAEAAESAVRAQEAMRSGVDALTRAQAATTSAAGDLLRDGTDRLVDVNESGIAAADQAAERTREVVRQGVDALRSSQTQVAGAVDTARENLVAATRHSTEAVEVVGNQLRDAGNRVELAVKELTTVQGDLNRRTEAVLRSAADIVEALRHVSQETATSILQLGNVVDRWDAAAAHWVDAAETVERGAGLTFRTAHATIPAQADPSGAQGSNGSRHRTAGPGSAP